MSKLRVTVLTGGRGSEREISLISGREVIKNLDSKKYEVKELVLDDDLDLILKIKADVVFIAVHGKDGEDGMIQGILDFLKIPYTGSGVLASAVGMNKIMFKRAIQHLRVAIPEWWVYEKGMKVSFPCVVKPADQGSSVGVSVVKEEVNFIKAVELAKKYSRDVIVEEYMKGMEVSCGVLGKCEEIVPARISDKVEERVKRWSRGIYKIVGCRGFARVDFIVRGEKSWE